MKKEKYFKTIVYASVFALLVGELLCFCIVSQSVNYPNIKNQYYTNEYSLIGIQGPTNWTANSLGIRGRELSNCHESEYRILTVGSSTTQCLFLDDHDEWPHKIEELLYKTSDGRNVWVGNIGEGGFSTRENIQQLLSIPDKINADMVIALPGAEDIHNINTSDQIDVSSYKNDDDLLSFLKENQRNDVYSGANAGEFFHPKRTSIAYFVRYYIMPTIHIFLGFDERNKINIEDYAKTQFITHLNCTNESKINRDNISHINIADEINLTEFSRNLNKMIDIAEKKEFRLIFVTQPFSNESLIMLNQEVLNVSGNRNVECINVGEMIPANHSIYYDKEEHFNANGASSMANLIADYLKNTEPFS